jgi:hypothetical protein
VKLKTNIPIGRSEKFNVAVQRPTVNLKEAENVGEQIQGDVAKYKQSPYTFSKHGTFNEDAAFLKHPIERAFED